MKILHCVEFYSPSVGGAQEVVKQLSEHLVKLGHDVTVATTKINNRKKKIINGVKIKEFDISGNMVVGMTGDIKKYQNYLVRSKFDIILTYAAQQWTTDAMLDILDKIKAKKVIVPCGFSGLEHPAFADYYRKMKSWIPKFDGVVFTSKEYQDYIYISNFQQNKLHIIRNGASEKEFLNNSDKLDIHQLLNIPDNHKIIFNVSSHVYSKGHKEAIKIFSRTKLKDCALVISANSFQNLECTTSCHARAKRFNKSYWRAFDRKRIIIRSMTREQTVAMFFNSDIFILPSKLECSPLVILESVAAGLPFISNAVGNVEEIVRLSNAGLIMNSASHGSKLLQQLLTNDEARMGMSNSGRKYWHSHARWDIISKEYQSLYKKLVRTK